MILDGMEGIWEGEWEGNKVEEGKENSREIQNRNVKKIEGKYGKNKKSNARNSDQNAIELEQEKFFENQADHWMTTKEAAEYLRISAKCLLNLTSNGKVKYFKLGRRNRFLLNDMRNLLANPKGDTYGN